MKNIFKLLFISITLISYTSCSDGNRLVDEISDNVDTTSGAVLRFLEVPNNLVNLSGDLPLGNEINYLLEVQEGDGSSTPDFNEVKVFISVYKNSALDDPILDLDGNVVEEQLFATLGSELFDTLSENNGLPQYYFESTSPQVLDLFPNADFPVVVYASYRFQLVMNNGDIWDETNSSGTVGGAFFNSPFTKKIGIRTNL